jgi:hypothetical protein
MLGIKGNIEVKVLISKEDDIFLAHALEMDIVAEGATIPEACKNLNDLIITQICFAIEQEDPTMIYHPAPREYFDAYFAIKMKPVIKIAFEAKKKMVQPISTDEIRLPISSIRECMSQKHSQRLTLCAN